MSSLSSVSDWDNEYARVARVASQLRTIGFTNASNQNVASTTQVVESLRYDLQRLDSVLTPSSSSNLHTIIPDAEIQRRRRLIQHLLQTSTNKSNATSSNRNHGDSMSDTGNQPLGQQSQMALAMQQQDEMIDQLAAGVGRLKTQTVAVQDEARLHVNLLNDMDANLDAAQQGLEDETLRASRLREDSSLWRLQLIAAGLTILLVLLIVLGLSP